MSICLCACVVSSLSGFLFFSPARVVPRQSLSKAKAKYINIFAIAKLTLAQSHVHVHVSSFSTPPSSYICLSACEKLGIFFLSLKRVGKLDRVVGTKDKIISYIFFVFVRTHLFPNSPAHICLNFCLNHKVKQTKF